MLGQNADNPLALASCIVGFERRCITIGWRDAQRVGRNLRAQLLYGCALNRDRMMTQRGLIRSKQRRMKKKRRAEEKRPERTVFTL